MPNGYGLYQNGKPLPADKAVLAKLPPPGSADGDALAGRPENAVRALARQRGHHPPTQAAPSYELVEQPRPAS